MDYKILQIYDGLEVVELFKEGKKNIGLALLDADEAVANSEVLSKPVSMNDLSRNIRRMLG